MNNNSGQGGGFWVERKIPLALIFTMVIQTLTFVWWAAKIDFQVQQNKKDIETMYVVQSKVIAMEAIFNNMLEEIRELRKDIRASNRSNQ